MNRNWRGVLCGGSGRECVDDIVSYQRRKERRKEKKKKERTKEK